MRWDDWTPRETATQMAFDLWRSGALTQAAAVFQHRLSVTPDSAEAWRGLGSVRWTQGRFAEAKICFTQSLAIEPANPMHWGNLGLALRDLGDKPAAIAAFAVATGLDPDYEPAWNEWANVLVDCGRPDQALPLYDHAIGLEPSRAVLYHNRGVCLRLLGNQQKAQADFLRCLQRNPGYIHSLNELDRIQNNGLARPSRSNGITSGAAAGPPPAHAGNSAPPDQPPPAPAQSPRSPLPLSDQNPLGNAPMTSAQ